jgi:hypothetical protein
MSRTIQLGAILGAMFITMFALAYLILAKPAFGSSPPGAPATVATTSLAFISTTPVTIIATSSCSARVISTASTSVMLTLSDYAGQSPNNTFGVFQAASTTKEYDSGQYGCGLVKAYGFAAGQITVMDVR